MPAGAPGRLPATQSISSHWSGQSTWTVLDTGFDAAGNFLDIWLGWRAHTHPPRMLHYVAVLSETEATRLVDALGQVANNAAPESPLAKILAANCYGLGDGFHRILLEDGRLSLTLCVDTLSNVLAQQEMQVDSVLAGKQTGQWDKWTLKALARHCKRGTTVLFADRSGPDLASLEAAGFVPDATTPQAAFCSAAFNPRWALRTSRRGAAQAIPTVGVCAVVGAGIAGASVARALALRGWSVKLLDAAPHAAAGASGLPVGLVVPHHSSDDSPRSRMSRAGTRLMLQHAGTMLVEGLDWKCSGVLELDIDTAQLDDVEAEVHSQSGGALLPNGWASRASLGAAHGLWHPHAAWIKPARLVAQWLDHERIAFQGNACVHTLKRSGKQWLLLDANGQTLTVADSVVFANAYACAAVVQRMQTGDLAGLADLAWVPDVHEKLQSLKVMHGTLTMAPCPAAPAGDWPAFPVNGPGSFVSGVPAAAEPYWYAGSTFEAEASALADVPGQHAANQRKLQTLLAQVADDVSAQFGQSAVQAWQGSRCVTHDRLPLVGSLEDAAQPSLWLSVGMGARGLSFSALCAELIAAWMGGEPLPIEKNRARALSTRRIRRKRG